MLTKNQNRSAWISDIEALYNPFEQEFARCAEVGKPLLIDAIEEAGGLEALSDQVLEILAEKMLAGEAARRY